MCGRYTIAITLDELLAMFEAESYDLPTQLPRYNVSPGQMIPAVISHESHVRIGELKWGLIPSWAKDAKTGFKAINARAETLLEKPAFRTPLLRKRCLIPADSFYEWAIISQSSTRGSAAAVKQPMRIMLKSNQLFMFAGLYDSWTSPDGNRVSSCTIITTEPNSLVAGIHDRMPVILGAEEASVWLNRGIQDPDILLSLLTPYPAEEMKAYPVSPKVGRAGFDQPELIEPVQVSAVQMELF